MPMCTANNAGPVGTEWASMLICTSDVCEGITRKFAEITSNIPVHSRPLLSYTQSKGFERLRFPYLRAAGFHDSQGGARQGR